MLMHPGKVSTRLVLEGNGRDSRMQFTKITMRTRREIMKSKNLLRRIGGFVLAAALLFGMATMSSTAVQARGRGGHGGGGHGGGFHGHGHHGGGFSFGLGYPGYY